MASDSSEPTRRKHRRSSSPDDADKRSKRRKHRHHHHRHRSKKEREETTKRDEGGIDEVEVEERKVDCDFVNNQDEGAVVMSTGGFAGVDYDMEEGEIVEDDNDGLVNYLNGDIEKNTKSLDSDVESGEIETNRYDHSIMGVNEDTVKEADINKMDLENGIIAVSEGGELGRMTASSSERLANRDYVYKYHKDEDRFLTGDVKRDSNSSDEVEQSQRLKKFSFEKRHKAVTRTHSHDKYLKDSSRSHLSRSPEPSRGRSRSQSIIWEASILGTLHNVDDPGNMERKHRSDSDDESMIALDRNYRHGRDDVRDKNREHSTSRYTERIEGQYSRDSRDRYREGGRDRDWDRTREKERKMETERDKERERTRLRDRGEKERERGRERTVDRDKERERTVDRDKEREREKDRERERARRERERVREERDMEKYSGRDGGRDRSQYKDRDSEKDRLSRRQKYDDEDGHRDRDNDYVRRRNYEDKNMKSERSDLENVIGSQERDRERGNLKREDDGQEDYQERISIQLAEQEEDDLERVKEESRRRRQAILEKYKKQNAQQNETQSQNMVKEQVGRPSDQVASAQSTVENFDSQVEATDVNVAEASLSVGKSPLQNGLVFKKLAGTGELGEGTPKSERSDDMFCDDMFCDDIFGETPAEMRKTGKGDGLAIEKSELHDNWDDAEGYYGYRFGEILDFRYEIIAAQGKGVFSTVVRAKDLKAKPCDPEEVAIKIIRNNETMYKAGMEELIILKKLVDADPENKRHCVRFLSNFKYRNHLCLVFESLHMNLREVLKKFGRNIGLKLTAVRTYAKQLFIALKHLKNCGVLHCDIKPDNMLVNEAKNVLKLCDFGNAMFAGKNEITPYLVSRFYRAPEIILGLPYDHPMDIWSVGCCLFEIYSGKVLFPGPSNNDMLRLHMELKGPFPKKMLRKGAFTDQHFDQDLNFLAVEEDPVTKKAVRRLMVNIKPKDFGTLISGSPGEDPKMLANFKDLLEKIFALDPDKRLNVSQALSHPFITGK